MSRVGQWADQAECRNHPELDWHPPETHTRRGRVVRPTGRAAQAIEVCQSCPVRIDCLAHAIIHDEHQGIWGGLTPAERLRDRKQLARLRLRVTSDGGAS